MKNDIYPSIGVRVIGAIGWLLLRVAGTVKNKTTPRAVLAAFPLLFIFGPSAEAQTGVVEGRVSDPIKGVYLEGAEVGVEGATKSTRTDNTGWYRLSELPLGAVTVK